MSNGLNVWNFKKMSAPQKKEQKGREYCHTLQSSRVYKLPAVALALLSLSGFLYCFLFFPFFFVGCACAVRSCVVLCGLSAFSFIYSLMSYVF